MNEQPELFEFSSPSKPKRLRPPGPRRKPSRLNVFLGILPDRQTAGLALDRIAAFLRNHRVIGTIRPWHKLHVSLLGLGFDSLSEDVLENVRRAFVKTAKEVALNTPPFQITFDRLSGFGGGVDMKRPLVLTQGRDENRPLTNLYDALIAEWQVNFGPTNRAGFTPHMTVLYTKHMIHHELVEPVEWMAREIVLVLSERLAEEYQVLGRWPLAA